LRYRRSSLKIAIAAIIAQKTLSIAGWYVFFRSETAITPSAPLKFNAWYSRLLGVTLKRLVSAYAPIMATAPYLRTPQLVFS